ncbi:MAG TPA: trehalase family glycosidase [Rhodothermales bacterium]|nr:trehalase family glycosidase [Rhodothermales bacterium]
MEARQTPPLSQDTPEVLPYLSRDDKWYLGGGNRLLWAPPFPVWLDTLGFWDEAQYYQFSITPVFTVTILDETGREIPYRLNHRQWQPDCLTQHYRTDTDLALTERKALLPSDVLISELALQNTSARTRTLRLVLWTVQESYPSKGERFLTNLVAEKDRFRFQLHTTYRQLPRYDFGCALGLDRPVQSFAAQLSQGSVLQPHWRFTPFYEAVDTGTLGDVLHTSGPTDDGLLYLGLLAEIVLPPHAIETVTFGFAAAPQSSEAVHNLDHVLHTNDAIEQSTAHWQRYFDRLPTFTCSDPFLQKYYWYRWYGLHLFTMHGGEGNYPYPAVYEGLAYFRVPITYSAQCHILETRWMDTPAIGQGSLRNFLHHQKPNGGFVGHLYINDVHQDSFYHANWAHIRHLHNNHPDDVFLQEAYAGLSRYADYFDCERDAAGSGLYDIQNMYETGQEYMHRYVAVEDTADRHYWGSHLRLKGVDVTVYLYEIKRLLAWIATHFDNAEAAQRWTEGADKTGRAILEQMWDPEVEMFFDVDPRTGERTGIKASVCFYPYLTDLVGKSHVPGLKQHLLNPEEFWTPYPVPSSSKDDRYFDAWAQWKEQRMNCPWNGRVWPMTNSHIAEALAHTALRFGDDELRQQAVVFMTAFIRMMFFDGDPDRPNCFEHYNPLTGKACEYRGVDDYQHSWIVELIIKYVAGIRPHAHGVTVDPFPFDAEHLRLDKVPMRGHRIGMKRTGDCFAVFVNGTQVAESVLGKAIELNL